MTSQQLHWLGSAKAELPRKLQALLRELKGILLQ